MNLSVHELDLSTDRAVVVVGLGFIGACIEGHLRAYQRQGVDVKYFPVDWETAKALGDKILSLCDSNSYTTIDIIWSAGKGGFSSGNAQMKQEFDYFSEFLLTISQVRGTKLIINFLSSAGGLYEGSGYVRSIDQLTLCRPYAKWKHKQEKILQNSSIPSRIYRISTVYGPSNNDNRRGLINTLIRGAKTGETVTISANQNTLRDYVFNTDVARQILRSIIESVPYSVQLLASGRSVSIDMLKNIVARATLKDVRLSYNSNSENDRDITFNRSLVAFFAPPTSLEEGIPLSTKFFDLN